jgi:hypothetical protein
MRDGVDRLYTLVPIHNTQAAGTIGPFLANDNTSRFYG